MKVLIVEDDAIASKIMEMFLERAGCGSDIACTGEAALQLYYDNEYDLIFMDIGLPDINGVNLAREIRTVNPHNKRVPIIAVTAHGNDETKEQCFAVGMNDFIVKPMDFNKLSNIITNFAAVN